MSLERRSFVRLMAAAGFTPAWLDPGKTSPLLPFLDEFPRQDPELVEAVVTHAHASLDDVRLLLEQAPELAKAAWDWGFGDWETALGAASHMGRRDIAELLLTYGAHPTIFSAAMLGHVDAVRGMVTASPGIQGRSGPHGITLLAHAQAGGDQARPVVDYLMHVGGADVRPLPADPPSDVATLAGRYRFGPGEEDVLEVEARDRGPSLRRVGSPRRSLVDLGAGVFHPVGAPSVRVDLSRAGRLVLVFQGTTLEARREMGP